jgi:hypothetical protein
VIHLGHLAGELLGVALREAPRDHEALAGAGLLVVRHLEDRVDRLFLRFADEAARVHDDDLGVGRVVHVLEAGAARDAEHDLGVDPVLGAAEAYKMNGARGCHGYFRGCCERLF